MSAVMMRIAATAFRALVGAVAGLLLVGVGFAVSFRETPYNPRSGDGVAYIIYTALLSLLAGALAARLGGPGARPASVILSLGPAAFGAYWLLEYSWDPFYGTDFYGFVLLCVMAPCCLLGAELWRRRWLRRSRLPGADA